MNMMTVLEMHKRFHVETGITFNSMYPGRIPTPTPTPNPYPYTLHPTPYTLHPTPYTLHPTPYTLHPTPWPLDPRPRPRPRTPNPKTDVLSPRPVSLTRQPYPNQVVGAQVAAQWFQDAKVGNDVVGADVSQVGLVEV